MIFFPLTNVCLKLLILPFIKLNFQPLKFYIESFFKFIMSRYWLQKTLKLSTFAIFGSLLAKYLKRQKVGTIAISPSKYRTCVIFSYLGQLCVTSKKFRCINFTQQLKVSIFILCTFYQKCINVQLEIRQFKSSLTFLNLY